ncbi:MAG: threonine/serine exporter family protein [Bacillota bacterium]|nr:threonine/serine exporter family protein [Bacillota bacterium]
MTSTLITQFILATMATCGLSIIFRVPVKKIPVCAIIGGLGWVACQVVMFSGFSITFGCFVGACAVALLSDISSKLLREAATIFIIPGIMPLVPGAGMYRTMLALLHNDMSGFATEGTQTLVAAGAIAVGLLVMGSLLRLVRTVKRKLHPASR